MPKPINSRGATPALAAALAALLLTGCGATEGLRVPGLSANWSGASPEFPTESATIQRIRNAPVAEPNVLTVEPGNVWPEQEAARATLADPDAALRGQPRFTPRSDGSRPDLPGVEGPRAESRPLSPRAEMPRVAGPRPDGQVIQTPDGAVVTTGGTDRVQSTISPRGSGVAIRDGNTVTVVEPGLPPRLVPAPR